jgi:acetone carboxylase gamma subunit
MTETVRIHEKFYNVEGYKQEKIRDLVQKNLDGKMDSYLKSITKKKDAEILLDYAVEKNKRNKYEAKFRLLLDGKHYFYSPKNPFKFEEDLVNHAFDHFKLALAG